MYSPVVVSVFILWFPFGFRCYDERALLFRTTISPFRSAPTAQRYCSPCPDKQRSSPSPARPSFPCKFCRPVFRPWPPLPLPRVRPRSLLSCVLDTASPSFPRRAWHRRRRYRCASTALVPGTARFSSQIVCRKGFSRVRRCPPGFQTRRCSLVHRCSFHSSIQFWYRFAYSCFCLLVEMLFCFSMTRRTSESF